MVKLLTPSSFWIQLGSLFFTLAGLNGDLLVIRFCLFLAYLLMVVNSVMGSPLWPNPWGTKGSEIYLDGVIWSVVGLYVQGSSLLALLLDEREVKLSDDAEALWRMMYRTGGLSKRLFQTIVAKDLRVVQFSAGQTIPTDDYFYIIYSGQVRLQVIKHNQIKDSRILVSGEMFDLTFMGMVPERSVFEDGVIRCTAMTPVVRLFQIRKSDMRAIANHPLAKSVWQALLINNLSYAVESYMCEARKSSIAELHCDRIFRPLEDWEQPNPTAAGSGQALERPWAHLFRYVVKSFSLPWPFAGHPTGVRQTQLPPPPLQPSENQAPPTFRRFGRQTSTTTTTTARTNSTLSFPSQLFRLKHSQHHERQVSNGGRDEMVQQAAEPPSTAINLSASTTITSSQYPHHRSNSSSLSFVAPTTMSEGGTPIDPSPYYTTPAEESKEDYANAASSLFYGTPGVSSATTADVDGATMTTINANSSLILEGPSMTVTTAYPYDDLGPSMTAATAATAYPYDDLGGGIHHAEEETKQPEHYEQDAPTTSAYNTLIELVPPPAYEYADKSS